MGYLEVVLRLLELLKVVELLAVLMELQWPLSSLVILHPGPCPEAPDPPGVYVDPSDGV